MDDPIYNFVDPTVVRKKFDQQADLFSDMEEDYRREGVICVEIGYPYFEFIFLAKYASLMGPKGSNGEVFYRKYPYFLFAIRLDFSNFDILPPSIIIIDPLSSRRTVKRPQFDVVIHKNQQMDSDLDNQRILLTDYKGNQFFCLRGIREYHDHPCHDGDNWMLYRYKGAGDIITILDQLQLYAIANYNYQFEQLTKKNGK